MSGSSESAISYRQATQEEIETVWKGLRGYNERFVSPVFARFMCVASCLAGRGETPGEAIIGGLNGTSHWGKMHVENIWVADTFRGRGVGSRLLQLAEQAAVERGCSGVVLDTMSFQALDFYRHRGYQVFGTIGGYQHGASRHYLHKALDRGPAPGPLRTTGTQGGQP